MITYWGSPTPNGSGGYTFSAPVAIAAIWEQRAEQTFDDKGKEIVSKAVVFLDQDVDVGGYLYNGTSVSTDPTTVSGAFVIRAFSKLLNRGGTKYERRAIL